MNEVATIDTNNFSAMAKAMGMEADAPKSNSKSSTLARLRIHHTPIMGQQEIGGKMKNVEVISGGAYKLEIPDGVVIVPVLSASVARRLCQSATPEYFVVNCL